MPETKRRYRRETRFAPSRSINFEPSVDAALVAAADAADTSVAAVVRACVDRGLPLWRDARRKRKRSGPADPPPPDADT